MSVSSASIVWPAQARREAWQGQEQEHSLFELLNGYKVLVKCSKNGTERSCEAEVGAGAGAWTGVRQDCYWPRC